LCGRSTPISGYVRPLFSPSSGFRPPSSFKNSEARPWRDPHILLPPLAALWLRPRHRTSHRKRARELLVTPRHRPRIPSMGRDQRSLYTLAHIRRVPRALRQPQSPSKIRTTTSLTLALLSLAAYTPTATELRPTWWSAHRRSERSFKAPPCPHLPGFPPRCQPRCCTIQLGETAMRPSPHLSSSLVRIWAPVLRGTLGTLLAPSATPWSEDKALSVSSPSFCSLRCLGGISSETSRTSKCDTGGTRVEEGRGRLRISGYGALW
jgi:hypothetical protein